MLKVTYTDTGLFLEYCPEPLDLLLSDRVCTVVHSQQAIAIQPMHANLLLPVHLIRNQGLETVSSLRVTFCDRDWVEITLSGLWVTETLEQEVGIFLTELDPRLEQRLLRLWQMAQAISTSTAIVQRVA
jgi:hypothetical protein